MIRQMEEQILALKKIGRPSVGNVLGGYAWLVYLVLMLQFAVLGIFTESFFVGLISLLFLILFVFSLSKQLRGKTKKARNNRMYNHLIAEFESTERQCLSYYGKSGIIRQQVEVLSGEVNAESNRRKRAGFRQHLIGWIIIVVTLGITGAVIIDLAKYADQEQAAQASPETAIEKSLKEGNHEEAIRLFLMQYMGETGDYDYARLIVEQLLRDGKREDAKAFAGQCTSLRYPSDLKKLKKLIDN
jgi:ATP/maltotriose-dependent transcriptional regulator MalT